MDRVSREAARGWAPQYPYRWDDDDLASRRQMLRFAVATSASLSLATVVLAVLGRTLRLSSTSVVPIARSDELGPRQARYFAYPKADEEGMLLRLPSGRLVAYGQRCTHLSCSVYYQPEHNRLFCPCHQGVFNPETGDPVAGPPRRRLQQIALRETGGVIYAVGEKPASAPLQPRRPAAEDRLARRHPPGWGVLVLGALVIGLLLMSLQLWVLTVALDQLLAGDGEDVWREAAVSFAVFAGGWLVLRVLDRSSLAVTRRG